MRWLLVLLVVASCKEDHRPSPSPPADPELPRLPVAREVPRPASPASLAPPAAPTSEPFIAGMGTSSTIPTKELSVRQVAYLYLLTVDVYLGEILRDTAAEAGDYAAGARDYYEIPSEILEVTKEYLARWPKLAGARAERAPQ